MLLSASQHWHIHLSVTLSSSHRLLSSVYVHLSASWVQISSVSVLAPPSLRFTCCSASVRFHEKVLSMMTHKEVLLLLRVHLLCSPFTEPMPAPIHCPSQFICPISAKFFISLKAVPRFLHFSVHSQQIAYTLLFMFFKTNSRQMYPHGTGSREGIFQSLLHSMLW